MEKAAREENGKIKGTQRRVAAVSFCPADVRA